jgi:hypothetical protein
VASVSTEGFDRYVFSGFRTAGPLVLSFEFLILIPDGEIIERHKWWVREISSVNLSSSKLLEVISYYARMDKYFSDSGVKLTIILYATALVFEGRFLKGNPLK